MTAQQLKTLRARLGWSQNRLAVALGVHRATILKWERGLHPIPPMAVRLLSCGISCSLLRHRDPRAGLVGEGPLTELK